MQPKFTALPPGSQAFRIGRGASGAAMTTTTLDPRVRELLELHESLTRQRLSEPNPTEQGRIGVQMECVRQRISEIERSIHVAP